MCSIRFGLNSSTYNIFIAFCSFLVLLNLIIKHGLTLWDFCSLVGLDLRNVSHVEYRVEYFEEEINVLESKDYRGS